MTVARSPLTPCLRLIVARDTISCNNYSGDCPGVSISLTPEELDFIIHYDIKYRRAGATTMATNDPRKAAGESHRPGDIMFGFHVVALIDLLGQAAELMRWDYLPQRSDEISGFLPALRATWGKIMHWRELIETNLRLWLPPAEIPAWVVNPDPEDVETFRRFQEFSLGFSHFSDTVIVYSPITNKAGFLKVNSVCALLFACGVVMLGALAARTPIRGALDLGMAGHHPDIEFYGPVLAKVHHLESKVAQYPRVVVGSRLVEYLRALAANPDDDGPSRTNRGLAVQCLEMLCSDHDGCTIVDYLGAGFTKLITEPVQWQGLRAQASVFVESELARFQAEKDDKLVKRYQNLVSYFHLRCSAEKAP